MLAVVQQYDIIKDSAWRNFLKLIDPFLKGADQYNVTEMSSPKTITREALYNLVWSKPCSAVAKEPASPVSLRERSVAN
jgi:hypothetical protein